MFDTTDYRFKDTLTSGVSIESFSHLEGVSDLRIYLLPQSFYSHYMKTHNLNFLLPISD